MDWRPNGHVGKWVTAAAQRAIVAANNANPVYARPGATTAWPEGIPSPGAPYRLPDCQPSKTQIHGLIIAEAGMCQSGWVHHNDFSGNAVVATRLDTSPYAGCWHYNHGLYECPGDRA